MIKIKIACSAIIILLISFLFSSFFSITMLVKLYENSLKMLDHLAIPVNAPIYLKIDNFINQQIYVALFIFRVLVESKTDMYHLGALHSPR